MGMILTCKYMQVLEHCTSQTILGKHAANGMFHQATGILLSQVTVTDATLPARITCIPDMLPVGPLIATHLYLLGIDDDHVITTINVRRKVGLVLAADQLRNPGGEATQCLPLCINHNPLLINSGCISRYGLVTQCIHNLVNFNGSIIHTPPKRGCEVTTKNAT